MLVALVLWLLAKLGMSVSPERLHELENEFYERPAWVNVHFGRVIVPDASDRMLLGIGYERRLGAQRYVGLGFVADLALPRDIDKIGAADFLVAVQAYVHPIRTLELTYAIGGYWHNEQLKPLNRWSVGYRVMTINFAPVPTVWLDLVGKHPRYIIGCQIEF
jgi:hypothetical protein